MNIFNWDKYNSNLKLVKKLTNYNNKYKFNYLENGLYNHIRDLFCLSLVQTFQKSNKRKKINILDYGSNLLTYSNLANKINLNHFVFSIYDPFSKKNNSNKKNIKIFKDKERLKNKWDMVNFGSSIQYLESINLLHNINFKSTKLVLITHTPISILKGYVSAQTNNKGLYQNIHSFNDIVKFFKKKGLELIFKSRNPDKFISAKKKYNTFSLNLLFIKK